MTKCFDVLAILVLMWAVSGATIKVDLPENSPLKLANLIVRGADLSGSNFTGYLLPHKDMSNVNFSAAKFDVAQLFKANFSDAILSGASFNSAQIVGANFTRSNLIQASFQFAQASGAILTKADVREAVFDYAQLAAADLRGVKTFEAGQKNRTRFNNANLAGAKLGGGHFFHANFSDANLSKADLTAARFYMAVLTGANLSHAIMNNTNLTKAELRGANLTGATMMNVVVDYDPLGKIQTFATLAHLKARGAIWAEENPPKITNNVMKKVVTPARRLAAPVRN